MIGIMNTALQGLQYNQRRLGDQADRISRWGAAGAVPGDAVDMTTEMVGALEARRGFEANLPVIRAADEMLGSLLDVLA